VHIPTWGVPSFLGEALPTLELLERAKAHDGVSILAHPARRNAWKQYDSSWAKYLVGIEVWNRKYDGWAPSPVTGELLRETKLVPFVSLDFHQRNQLFPLSMQLDISGPVIEDNVISSLRTGACQATAFSQPIDSFLSGWRGASLPCAEKMRRAAASVYRSVKGRR